MTQKIKEGKSKIYILRDNNEVVGFTQCTLENKDFGIIEYLFVSPHCRNNGYGKMLMERAIEYFNNKNIKTYPYLINIFHASISFDKVFSQMR